MVRIAIRILPALFAITLAACGDKSDKPDTLKASLQKAIDAGDGPAVLALADLKGAPAMMSYMLLALPEDCSGDTVCTVSLAPVDAEWEKQAAANPDAADFESTAKPEGLLTITGKPKAEGGSGSMNMSLPYAKVDGGYRIVSQRYTAAKLAKLQATTAQAAAEATLAQGIPDQPGTSDRNMDWKAQATALPAGGGEPGAAYLANLQARTSAVKANDPDAAVAATGAWGEAVLGATDYSGAAVPMETRKAKLRAQAVRWPVEANVLGGWIKEPIAVLVIEGRNGVGNTLRGAQLMELVDGAWTTSSADFTEIPGG